MDIWGILFVLIPISSAVLFIPLRWALLHQRLRAPRTRAVPGKVVRKALEFQKNNPRQVERLTIFTRYEEVPEHGIQMFPEKWTGANWRWFELRR